MRLAISAAPALVKVRHRIASGRTPASSRRSTRAVSTWVLPVPAEADSAACADGIGREALIAFEDREWFEAARHRGTPSKPLRASQAGERRIMIAAERDQGTSMSDPSDHDDDERSAKLVKAGVAVGIGSAAIVAALLYASKVKKPKRGK